jgi:hypothetical protein
MAMAMREAAGKLIAAWRRHGCELGFGAGIAQGSNPNCRATRVNADRDIVRFGMGLGRSCHCSSGAFGRRSMQLHRRTGTR